MIKNIVFDMGNVLLRFDPAYFIERAGAAEEDKELLLREVYRSLDCMRRCTPWSTGGIGRSSPSRGWRS